MQIFAIEKENFIEKIIDAIIDKLFVIYKTFCIFS